MIGLVVHIDNQGEHHQIDRDHDGDQGEDEHKDQEAGLALGLCLLLEEIHIRSG